MPIGRYVLMNMQLLQSRQEELELLRLQFKNNVNKILLVQNFILTVDIYKNMIYNKIYKKITKEIQIHLLPKV